MRTISLLVIHCSASVNGGGVTIADIDRWHRERGFRRQEGYRLKFRPELRSVGYHYVIEADGAVRAGRLLDEPGAHVAGRNGDSIGICMVGVDAYSAGQWKNLALTVRELQSRFPGLLVAGHRDLSPDKDGDGVVEPHEWLKTCPGFDVAAWLAAGMLPDVKHVLRPSGAKR